jgi:hypothetical protein
MKKRILTTVALMGAALPTMAQAEDWTPLITSTMFDGIRADLILMVGGIVTLFFIVFGLAMLMRAGGR